MRSNTSCLGLLGLTLTLGACSSDGDSNFDELVGSGIGTFGEPLQHPCEEEASTVCEDPAGEGTCYANALASCATQYYLRGYSEQTLPDCDPSRPLVTIDQDLDLKLFRGHAIRDEYVVSHTRGLQRYYEPHALWMWTDDVSASVDMEYALVGSNAEFNAALLEANIDPEVDEDAASALIGQVMFAPTRAFLAENAVPIWAGVNVVVIRQILSPELASLLEIDGTVVGLGLSSALLAKTDAQAPDSVGLNTLLATDEDFTPSLFVGHEDIVELTGTFDLVIAHELGHALGLAHVDDSGNLMEQGGRQDCRRWLSESQVAEMGPFSDVILSPSDALLQLSQLPRQIARKLAAER